MEITKEMIDNSANLYKSYAALSRNNLPTELIVEFESVLEDLEEGHHFYKQLICKRYIKIVDLDDYIEDHYVTIYNYLFDVNFSTEQFNDSFTIDSEMMMELIYYHVYELARLEYIIHHLVNGEIDKDALTTVFINDLDAIATTIDQYTPYIELDEIIESFKALLENCIRDGHENAKEQYFEVANDHEESIPGDFSSDSMEEQSYEETMEEFNQLIGMDNLKNDIQNVLNLLNIQRLRKEKGLNTLPVSRHMVFTGNPGTGKTTVARYLAKIYKSLGILAKGQLVEIDRAGLVAGYVGQTAIKTDEVISSAIGGVLFIDEAYTLAADDFGREAIDTLLKRMEDYRDELVVIVAGYTNEMKSFINSNPGLESRFNKYIHFDDFTPQEMALIFEKMCAEQNYTVDEQLLKKVEEIAMEHYLENGKYANARLVRNVFEKAITNQANRLMLVPTIADEDLSILVLEDIVG